MRLQNCWKIPKSACVVSIILVAPASYAHHHDANNSHEGHGQHGSIDHSLSDNPAVVAYQTANDRMHADMAVSFTGDPDVDFAKGMIPHHEGAIAMSEIVLEYGEDEEIRQLAEEIIAAQESEIAFLREWLEKHGH
ncbi:DUF305 domain-containing protein [Vreelandella nigrificans]|uniref:DUF305 domain-containing protein n=1 Tax=Vreelandella nigrificans TaxID=2042704 RepID=A0A2A4HSS7_9GAMM|nr:DUF305 domain-containing protein [Halomonas nigrificans]